VVTICTTSLTFNNSTFCPHSIFMCFVWISEQTAIISLYNINWLVFIIETECVYCAVRTGALDKIQVNFSVYCVKETLLPCKEQLKELPHREMLTRIHESDISYHLKEYLDTSVFFRLLDSDNRCFFWGKNCVYSEISFRRYNEITSEDACCSVWDK